MTQAKTWGVVTPDGIFTKAPRGEEQATKWANYKYGTTLGDIQEVLTIEAQIPAPLEHPICELKYNKVAMETINGKLQTSKARRDTIADQKAPNFFRRFEGSYAEVAAEAVRRNQAQERSGFMDFLYYPEVVPSNVTASELENAA